MKLAKLFQFFIPLLFLVGCHKPENSKTTKTVDHEIFRMLVQSEKKSLQKSQRLALVDSIYSGMNNYPLDSFSLAILYQKSNLHYDLKQKDSAFFYDKLLLKKARLASNDYYQGKASIALAYYYKNKGIYDSSFYYYNTSKNHFLKLNDSSQVGRRLLSMANIQKNQGDYFGSKETLTEALKYLDPEKDVKYFASVYNSIATNHRRLLNLDDAITYYLKAITTTKSKNDKISYKNNLATTYRDNKEYIKAIDLLKALKSDSLVDRKSSKYARILDNLSYAEWLYNAKDVRNSYFQALDLRLVNEDIRGEMASYLHLGEYFLKDNPQLSRRYFNKAIKVSKHLNNPKVELEALQFLIQLNPKNIEVRDRYISVVDSLNNEELKAKTQFAKYKYDDKLKQEAINNLTRDTRLKALEISQQKNQKIVAFLLVMIAVISGFFLFYYLRQKHKKEKLKEIYSTETRISKKVHDELANDVYNIMNRIQNNSKIEQDLVVEKLQDVYRRTRDISYENGTINLEDEYFYLELKEMINSYQSNNTRIITKNLKKQLWKGISDDKKIVTERVLKELMTNMKKHSKASNVLISFNRDKRNLSINYIDDGVGLKNSPNFKSSGLQNVENRIKNIDGTFKFDTTKYKESGIRIKFSFPI